MVDSLLGYSEMLHNGYHLLDLNKLIAFCLVNQISPADTIDLGEFCALWIDKIGLFVI